MAIVGAHALLYTSEAEKVRGLLRGVSQDEGYGITVMLGLRGGVDVMLYEPRHPVAIRV